MELKTSEALVKYVAEMHDREKEYEYSPSVVVSDLEDKETDFSNKIQRAYENIAGERVCVECKNNKLFDQKKNEFYCPIHD